MLVVGKKGAVAADRSCYRNFVRVLRHAVLQQRSCGCVCLSLTRIIPHVLFRKPFISGIPLRRVLPRHEYLRIIQTRMRGPEACCSHGLELLNSNRILLLSSKESLEWN